MKKLLLLIGILIGFILCSCSNNNDTPQQESEETIKKLVTERRAKLFGGPQGNFYRNFERNFTYNSNNKVTDINIVYTGGDQWKPELTNTTFNYDNNKITSSTTYEDGVLYNTSQYNYSNDQLIEVIKNDSNGIEYEKHEMSYDSKGKISVYKFYPDQQLYSIIHFEYDASENLTTAVDGTNNQNHDFQFDQNLSAYEYFTIAEKIIFNYEGLFENISKNNNTSHSITYNANSSSEIIFYHNTTIEYDNKNYPLTKTRIQTYIGSYGGPDLTTDIITYEYE